MKKQMFFVGMLLAVGFSFSSVKAEIKGKEKDTLLRQVRDIIPAAIKEVIDKDGSHSTTFTLTAPKGYTFYARGNMALKEFFDIKTMKGNKYQFTITSDDEKNYSQIRQESREAGSASYDLTLYTPFASEFKKAYTKEFSKLTNDELKAIRESLTIHCNANNCWIHELENMPRTENSDYQKLITDLKSASW